MKKVALVFGLLSGAVTTAVMMGTILVIDTVSYRRAEILGYTGLFVSALLVFFGIRSFRENAGQGRLTFSKGVAVGLLISLVASICYVTAFQLSFLVIPDLGQKFAACMVRNARESGASPEKVKETEAQAEMLQGLMANPLTLAAVSFAESFPIGLGATLLSAGILRRRSENEVPPE